MPGAASSEGTSNSGRKPTKNPFTAYATMDPSMVKTRAPASNSISPYRTSMAKIAVPIGDRKIADRPAAMPTNISRRVSSSERWRLTAYTDPIPALIKAVGPSRPAEPPEPMVMAEAISLTKGTRARMTPPRL